MLAGEWHQGELAFNQAASHHWHTLETHKEDKRISRVCTSEAFINKDVRAVTVISMVEAKLGLAESIMLSKQASLAMDNIHKAAMKAPRRVLLICQFTFFEVTLFTNKRQLKSNP